MRKTFVSLIVVACLAACHPGGNIPDNADTYTQGQCTYKDAEKKPDGQPQPPAQPEPQPDDAPMQVEVHVSGSGSLSGLTTPSCQLEGGSGQFKGLMSGEGEVDDNGGYFAGFVQSEGAFTTPSGSCEIPQLSIGALTEVVIVGKLKNTQKNCQTYCSAKARSWAEG